jgi:hypothetical protein
MQRKKHQTDSFRCTGFPLGIWNTIIVFIYFTLNVNGEMITLLSWENISITGRAFLTRLAQRKSGQTKVQFILCFVFQCWGLQPGPWTIFFFNFKLSLRQVTCLSQAMCCVVVVYLHSIQLTLISNLLPRPNQKSNKARDVAQWWSTCPVCEKPWFDPQYHKKKKKKIGKDVVQMDSHILIMDIHQSNIIGTLILWKSQTYTYPPMQQFHS